MSAQPTDREVRHWIRCAILRSFQSPTSPKVRGVVEDVTFGGDVYSVLIEGSTEHNPSFSALTISGELFATNKAPYAILNKRYTTPAWNEFRAALLSKSPNRILKAAKKLPRVRMSFKPNDGLQFSMGRWILWSSPVVR